MSQVFFHERRCDGGTDATPCACQNCDWEGEACDLNGISDYEQRVSPGEITPAGECPECGALAHVADVPAAEESLSRFFVKVFESSEYHVVVEARDAEEAREIVAERWAASPDPVRPLGPENEPKSRLVDSTNCELTGVTAERIAGSPGASPRLPRAADRLRAFLEDEVEAREVSGVGEYVQAARDALAALADLEAMT